MNTEKSEIINQRKNTENSKQKRNIEDNLT